jgi:hypothetical protein
MLDCSLPDNAVEFAAPFLIWLASVELVFSGRSFDDQCSLAVLQCRVAQGLKLESL